MDRWRRIIGTGLSFALFGVGSLVVGLVVFPYLAATRPPAERELAVQRVVHWTFQAFIRFMAWVGVVEVSAVGAERLARARGALIVANHPTLVDIVAIGSCMPQFDCVVKKSHWTNPATFGVVRGAGYVPNDTGVATLEACVARLRAGRNLVLFPEGTRSPMGGLGEFQRGAAHVAIDAGVDAIPVTITCVPPGLMRGQAWYDVPPSRMHIRLVVGEPIASGGAAASRARAARSLTRRYRQHFEDGLGLSR